MGYHNDTWHKRVDERIQLIANGLTTDTALESNLPGLKSLLDDYLDDDVVVDQDDFHRRLLRVFRDSHVDNTYQELFAGFSPTEQAKVSEFVDGKSLDKCCLGFHMGASLGAREHFSFMAEAETVRVSKMGPVHVRGLSMGRLRMRDCLLFNFVRKLSKLFRRDNPEKDSVLVYKDTKFQNWGLVVDYAPTYTCIPSSVAGIQRIVKFAKQNNMGVRCAGFRHSWAPIFGRNGQILISLLGLHEATILPNFTALAIDEPTPTDLETITIIPNGTPRTPGNTLVRVGASTTNERLRRWCIDHSRLTLPLNTIMVEMTLGGTNAPICHGSGRAHSTLSDLVRKVEYVDANGEVRVVDKPEQLRAAAGCFGLMGVVTHLTLELQPMTYALLRPVKIPMVRAVPPPEDVVVPPALRVEGLTEAEKAADLAAFEKQASDSYYSEWFWFPYSDYAWINCWDTTTDAADVEPYPSPAAVFFQFVSQFTLNVLSQAQILNDLIQTTGLTSAAVTLLSRAAMLAMPETPSVAALPDALHFQRGIQNIRVLNLEVELPLQPRADAPSKPDFALVRRAWWDGVLACYAASETCPQRMPLEMRIMGASDVVMAPQRGNTLGTCAIEILTLEAARELWDPYAQGVLDRWMSYVDTAGRRVRPRPHWAKQWVQFKVDGRPWVEQLKEVDYKEQILEFKTILAEIGREHGWTLADLKGRFSNDFFDSFYFDDVEIDTGSGEIRSKTQIVHVKG